jgi:hypothetical protein
MERETTKGVRVDPGRPAGAFAGVVQGVEGAVYEGQITGRSKKWQKFLKSATRMKVDSDMDTTMTTDTVIFMLIRI